MEVEPPQNPYEVRCEACHVSFPVGTRRCVHCGGRVGGSLAGRLAERRTQLVPNPGADEPWEDEESDEELAAGMARRRFLSPFTLMWLAAAVALSIQRACG